MSLAARNFNPRTREGCDFDVPDNMLVLFFISIHAPVKGATEKIIFKERMAALFQSTHP